MNKSTQKKTNESFIREVYNLVGDEYLFLEPYINAQTNICVQHKNCGYEWKVKPYNFLNGSRCPKCFGSLKKTTQQFKEEVYKLVGDEFSVLGEYTTARTNILIKHNTCGCEFEMFPNSFLMGQRCSRDTCIAERKRETTTKTHETFLKEVYNLVGDEYTILESYYNSTTKILIKHNKCGFQWYSRPAGFLKGNHCPKCGKTMKLTQIEVVEQIFALVGDEYSILDEYKKMDKKILMKHNKCGHIWKVKPNNFIYNKTRCPLCYSSKGEKIIRQYLIEHNIVFEEQKRFSDCRGKKYPLKFDFYLPDLNCCIEFDGEQHFKPKGFGSKNTANIIQNFKILKNHDEIKNNYCKQRQINLIRISYLEVGQICQILKENI